MVEYCKPVFKGAVYTTFVCFSYYFIRLLFLPFLLDMLKKILLSSVTLGNIVVYR